MPSYASMDARRVAPLALAIAAATVSFAGQNQPGANDAKNAVEQRSDDKSPKFPSPELAKLDRLIGHWEVVETQYSPTGAVLSTTKGTEDNTWTLGQHVLRRAYSTKGEVFYEAVASITWNQGEKKYRGVWFDNVSTSGPTQVIGSWNEEETSMVWMLEITADDGSKTQYKVVERFDDEETRTGLTYLVRGSELVKRMEVRYKRALPCPTTGFRMIDDITRTSPRPAKPDEAGK